MWTRRQFVEAACGGAGAMLVPATAWGKSYSGRGAHSTVRSAEEPFLPAEAARAVLERQLGSRAKEFNLRTISAESGREVYEIEAERGCVTVSGSSAVAICRGVYSYLRNQCRRFKQFHCDAWIGFGPPDNPCRLPGNSGSRYHGQNSLLQRVIWGCG